MRVGSCWKVVALAADRRICIGTQVGVGEAQHKQEGEPQTKRPALVGSCSRPYDSQWMRVSASHRSVTPTSQGDVLPGAADQEIVPVRAL